MSRSLHRRPVGVFVGLTVLDVVSRVSRFPGVNEKVTASEQVIAAGGPAANAAVAFAALGGDATLFTALGDSAQAGLARADLESCGVTVVDMVEEFQMSISSVTVSESTGDRSIVSTDGNSSVISPSANSRDVVRLAEALKASDVLLIDGHHPELAALALEHRTKLLSTVIDAGRWKPQFEWILPLATHVVASQDFADPHGWVPNVADVRPNLNAVIVRTRGSNPMSWWENGAAGEVVPRQVQAVDSSGAGDIFHGAFAYHLANSLVGGRGTSLEDALSFAAKVAAVKVQSFGPRRWLTSLSTCALQET